MALFSTIFSKPKKQFRILSIDGGGVKGVYSAKILCLIEKDLGINIREQFDLIAGTSVGAIISAAIATGIPVNKAYEFFSQRAAEFFKTQGLDIGVLKSRYTNTGLINYSKELFDDIKLRDINTKLLITATDIANGKQKVFRSYQGDTDILVSDAVIASCSAPIVFSPYLVKGELLADGGIWANNPVILAIHESMIELGYERKEIKCLSIGTGVRNKYFEQEENLKNNWGLVRWNLNLIEQILDLQSNYANESAELLLTRQNYLRLNFQTEKQIMLDNTSPKIIQFLEDQAIKTYELNRDKIKKIFE